MTRAAFGRRQFIAGATAVAAALALPGDFPRPPDAAAEGEIHVDVAIIGGGLGGYAALRALREEGYTVAITSPFPWFGGQLTSQGVPLDEHFWIEQIPSSRLYRDFRDQLRRWYRLNEGLTAKASTTLWLDPGDGQVSPLCTEPRVAAAMLDAAIVASGSPSEVVTLRGYVPERVERTGDRFDAVTLLPVAGGASVTIVAQYFIDATELGDLLELGGVEHVTGAESQAQTGEPSAPSQAAPLDQQAITWCFALEYRPGGGPPIPRPANYDTWRTFRPALTPPWPGPLFSWTYSAPRNLQPRTLPLLGSGGNWWTYRRIRAASNFAQGGNDITLVNWPQNDYQLRPLLGPGTTPTSRQQAFAEARDLSRSFLYWLQTEAPRHDGGTGYPELQLSPATMGTADGLAMHPYIREGRRLQGLFTVREQHISPAARRTLGLPSDRATEFTDTVGIGQYVIDLHPTTGGHNYFDTDGLAYQIPWGALVPQRVTNLLAVGLSVSTSHLANGAFRLHSTEFATGVAAGYGAAYCLVNSATPAQVRASATLMQGFQQRLADRGVWTAWPRSMTAFTDVPPTSPGAAAIWILADQGTIRGYTDTQFAPDDTILRAQVAALICRLLGWSNEVWPNPFTDQGGILDGLWRAVATLAGRGIAKGFGDGTFGPNLPVTKLQSIGFITRAFVTVGTWVWQTRPGTFPNIPPTSGHRRDIETYIAYTGGIEECPASEPWPDCNSPAPRWWFAATLHLALDHPTPQP